MNFSVGLKEIKPHKNAPIKGDRTDSFVKSGFLLPAHLILVVGK